MSLREALGPGDVGRLGAAAVQLEKLAEGAGRIGGEVVSSVPRRLCRAYVWAVYTGADPALAIAGRFYGARSYADLGPGAVRHVRAIAARLASFDVTIPRQVGRRAA